MPLEKFATLRAIAAVFHTRHQPAPSTVASASSDLLEFDFRSRLDVERVAPSASGQADRPSTNVAGQTTQPGQSKKIKNHESPGVKVVCRGKPPLVQAVIQLLAEPLHALLGTDKYKTFLQRPQSFQPLDSRLAKVNVRKLVDLPARLSSIIQGRDQQVDMSWVHRPASLHPLLCTANRFILALKKSLRPHPMEAVDETDHHNQFRAPGLVTVHQSSPVERLFTSCFEWSYACCGNSKRGLITCDGWSFSQHGILKTLIQPKCNTCLEKPQLTYELKQAPAFVLVAVFPNLAKFEEPPQFNLQRLAGIVHTLSLVSRVTDIIYQNAQWN